MNRFLTVLLGLMATGVGCVLGALAIIGLVGISDQEITLVPLILALFMSFAMLSLGLITLTSYAYETGFDKNGIEMQFVFRKERVSWESIRWHRNLFFRNTFSGGANVWVMLNYSISGKDRTRFRRAILLVVGTGPAVGMVTRDFETPFDSWRREK